MSMSMMRKSVGNALFGLFLLAALAWKDCVGVKPIPTGEIKAKHDEARQSAKGAIFVFFSGDKTNLPRNYNDEIARLATLHNAIPFYTVHVPNPHDTPNFNDAALNEEMAPIWTALNNQLQAVKKPVLWHVPPQGKGQPMNKNVNSPGEVETAVQQFVDSTP